MDKLKMIFFSCLLVFIFSCKNGEKYLAKEKVNAQVSIVNKNPSVVVKNALEYKIKNDINGAGVSSNSKLTIQKVNWKDEFKAIEEKMDFNLFLKNIYDTEKGLSAIIEDKDFFVNYKNMELDKFIKLIAKVLKFDYILHSEVKGNVTINLKNDIKLTNKQLWLVLDYILNINAAYISITDNKIVNILPLKHFEKNLNKAIYQNNSNVALYNFKLKHNKSADIIKLLKKIFKNGISIIENPNKRDVIVISTSENLSKIDKLIREFDKKKDDGWNQQILHCENQSPSFLVKELAVILEVLGFPIVTKHLDNKGQHISLIPLERHQAILISSPNLETIDYIRNWLKQIDYKKTNTKVKEKLFIYPVKYSNAAVLIESINVFFNQTSITQSNSTAGEANGAVTNSAVTNNAVTNNAGRFSNSDENVFSDKIVLYEDHRVNRIILKCRPRTFTFVKTLLDILDAPPLQALVRVTAVDIQLNDDLQYGFSYAANKQFGNNNSNLISGVGSSIATGALQIASTGSAPSTGLGLLFQRAGVSDGFGFIRAVANNTDTRLLNTPEILVQNLKTASIQIGSDVPYSAGIQQNNNATTVQNIQYRNTGVLLEVTPDIGLNGYISLKVKQEISSIADSAVAGIQSPTFNKSLIETSLTLKDGETFLIGGIITTRDSNTEDGVPILKDIPLIGKLFKSKSSGTQKSELVILVTVKSVRGKNKINDILARYYHSVKELKHKKRPIFK